MTKERRKIRLIQPGLQLRFVGAFAGLWTAGFVVLTVFVLSRVRLEQAALAEGAESTSRIWLEVGVLAAGLFLPLMIVSGILVTHRIAGPAYRIEQHLRAVLRDEDTGPCRLRRYDELGSLCDLVNETVTHLRAAGARSDKSPEERRQGFRAVV